MLTSLFGALLISLCLFAIGYWAWPPGMFLAPISILSVGNLTWAALSLCFWIGGFRHLQAYIKKERGRQESEVQASEIKIVIPCPYCDFKLRIPVFEKIEQLNLKYCDEDSPIQETSIPQLKKKPNLFLVKK